MTPEPGGREQSESERHERMQAFAAGLPLWEYMVISPRPGHPDEWQQHGEHWAELDGKSDQEVLDWLGEEAWELIAVDRGNFYFRRQRFRS